MTSVLSGLCALAACSAGETSTATAGRNLQRADGGATFETRIHQPPGLTSVLTDQRDDLDRPVRIACRTCHSLRAPGTLPTSTDPQLGPPHTGLSLTHGTLQCAACHDPNDGTQLHLADGSRLAMAEAMTLCSQCHGPQRRDYDHGAHGGMRGYWDLTRGPQERNHCVDCHDPHAPAFPVVQPAPPPRDRFLTPKSESSHAR